MKSIDAGGQSITASMLRKLLKGLPTEAIIRMSIEQQMRCEDLGLTILVVIHDTTNLIDISSLPPRTVGSHRLIIDPDISQSIIRAEVDYEIVFVIGDLAF